MALPTLEQYRQSAATWRREHKGVTYTLSHHGVSNYNEQGTWCFYVHLLEPAFINPEDFARFDREPVIRNDFGTAREHYPYEDVPDHGFHGGITWYERTFYVGKDGQRWKALKIGCDYAHLFDREGGYWEGLDEVDADAKALIDRLVVDCPQKTRCAYCGKLDLPDQFYTARNGALVHRSQASKFSEDNWPMWLPVEPTAAEGVA